MEFFYVKEEKRPNSEITVYWIYAKHPADTTGKPLMFFSFKENAEIYCKALNAEFQNKPWTDCENPEG